jgi:3-oxoacyl-[acyl-carrier protein] reductase
LDLGLSNKKALVCGASKGLGFACAQSLAEEGAEVILVSRNASNLTVAALAIQKKTGRIPATSCADLAVEADCNRLIEEYAGVDILVTNAGGPPSADFRELSRQQWNAAWETNCLSAVTLIGGFVNHMIEKSFGRVINITSMTVRVPVVGLDLSNATRLALTGFVAGVSRQIAYSGVTMNNLLPGTVMTQRLAELGEIAGELVRKVPAGRAGEPEEFGATCAFLCSEQAAYINGQNILIDGGLCSFTV